MRKLLLAVAVAGSIVAAVPARADDGLGSVSIWDEIYQALFGPSPAGPTTGGMQSDNLGDGLGM